GQKSSFVSSADVAEVATTTLLNPSVHNSKTYELTGGEALTGAEVAQLMTAIGGKTITYTDLPPDQYAEGARSSGMPEPYVEAFLGLEAAKAAGYAASVSSHVQDVLKRPPEAYEAFLKRHKARIPVPGSA
ncbi:MAG: SDR family NAD(P)-dependent oxidoreductase, partial [Myxococcota bacterium]